MFHLHNINVQPSYAHSLKELCPIYFAVLYSSRSWDLEPTRIQALFPLQAITTSFKEGLSLRQENKFVVAKTGKEKSPLTN